MKHTIQNFLIGLALTAFSVSVSAQAVTENGITTKKTVTTNSSGKYEVELEINANGGSSTSDPITSDIVLVLDVSGSMDDPLGTPEALPSASYSYDSFGNNTYYYKDGNNYRPVYRATGLRNNTRYYFLYYIVPDGNDSYLKYILYTANGQTGKQPFGSNNQVSDESDFGTLLNTTRAKTSPSDILYTGVLYKGTRMDALKNSVNTFIEKLKENSAKLPSGFDNQISIVKFGLQNNNSLYYSNGTNQILYNNASIVADFTALTEDGAATLTGIVNNFVPGGGTGANLGLTQALNQFNNSNLSESSKKTVVLFTDGKPSSNDYYNPINTALQLKNKGIKVYTVGIFDEETTAISDYMNSVSSNYPNAQASNIYQDHRGNYSGTIKRGARNTDVDKEGKLNEYYFLADSQEGLEAIFATLAEASGSSEEQVGASTEVRDVVASSFTLPAEMSTSQISYKVMKISSTGDSWTEDTQYDKSGIEVEFGKKSYTENGKTIQKDTIGVTGFDFSKDDTTVGLGDGNWVGNRIPDPTDRKKDFIAGRKLVISFIVEAKDGVTGGDTMTNGEDSGVYVLNPKTGEYECKNHFYLPEKQLPINILITKTGLRHGESATFKIMKIDPKKDADGHIVYNALGKPVPNETEPVAGQTDPYKARGWKNFSKVIMTNKGADGTNRITKTLLNLDPNWVYLVIEDDWAWSYETKGAEKMQTTSSVPVNPFSFTNEEKTGVVKHAEAVMINHFATSEEGEADVEHYKSSKVESFTTPK